MDPAFYKITIHLITAVLAGGVIGIERSFHGRPAGFRTHALVCLSSSLLMTVTVFQGSWLAVSDSELFRTDPTRMAQGIMTGIGFLGAGVIFKEGLSVRGLTTAASIWITAGVGILYGIGFYFPAILATALTLIILSLFKWIEHKIPSHHYTNGTIAFNRENVPNQEHIKDLLKQYGFRLESMSYQVLEGGLVFEYKMTIRTNDPLNLTRLSKYLIGQLEVKYFQISPFGD